MRTVIAIGCFIAMPLVAQTTTTSTDTTGTMSTTTTTTMTATKKATSKPSSKSTRTKVWNDATRLAALLNDAQNQKVTFSAATWRSIGNEANMLANRIFAASGARADARELRTHVREMRSAALKGDADGARSHASLALPFAYKMVDWGMGKA